MRRRHFCTALPVFVLPTLAAPARAQDLQGLLEGLIGSQRHPGQQGDRHRAAADSPASPTGSTRGLKTALETGATAAVKLLGRPDGFLANPQVHIPLPKAMQDAARLMRNFGMGKQIDDLEVSLNRAAESAVPMAMNLLVDAVRNITVGRRQEDPHRRRDVGHRVLRRQDAHAAGRHVPAGGPPGDVEGRPGQEVRPGGVQGRGPGPVQARGSPAPTTTSRARPSTACTS